ncbi:MAG TPA: hypothetical protein PLX06_00025 [Fimbriimonadaceae bacterium]|nr:hypothetical protein [Fimbriimonadaceae bacterium]
MKENPSALLSGDIEKTLSNVAVVAGFLLTFVLASGILSCRLVFAEFGVGFPEPPREMVFFYGIFGLLCSAPALLLTVIAAELFVRNSQLSLRQCVSTGVIYAVSASILMLVLYFAVLPITAKASYTFEPARLLPWWGAVCSLITGVLLGAAAKSSWVVLRVSLIAGAAVLMLVLLIGSLDASSSLISALKPEFYGRSDHQVAITDAKGTTWNVELLFDLPNELIVRRDGVVKRIPKSGLTEFKSLKGISGE